MFHETHTAIARPDFLVVVANNVFVVWIGVFSQVALRRNEVGDT